MAKEIGLFDAIYTQRAIRRFKSDPVPDEMIRKLIDSATKAPSGANRQPWKFLVIRDAETRRRIGEYYLRSWEISYPKDSSTSQRISPQVYESADHLARHFHEAPVFILACREHDGSPSTMSTGASIYPAVQNLLLAARGLGLGSALTTLHKRYEQEIKALLGIPQNVETAALLPVGYPADGVQYGPTRRAPVEEVTYWEKWGAKRQP